ncbi:patatin-like phospholipase protein [Ceratobasidium sp. AG-Ba]|nr:patatin-like phospholipase protein [Ceratobasidium sp. AG-Ba]
MSGRTKPTDGLNILVIEDGGARGLSSLLLLDQIMLGLKHRLALTHTPSVREHFEIVAGTGTGALIACMVGRLGIPVEQAIGYYIKLDEVFSDRKRIGTTAYKATKLREVLKAIVRNAVGDENKQMIDSECDGDKCRTLVFAESKYNINANLPHIFRSYQAANNPMPDCAIWEAVSASMAHPGMFKAIEIGEGPMQVSFISSTLRSANLVAQTTHEATLLFPNQHVSAIVSLETDATSPMLNPESRAEKLLLRFQSTPDVYFRFKFDKALKNIEPKDWEKLDSLVVHTRVYMMGELIAARLSRAVWAIDKRRSAIRVDQIHVDQKWHRQIIEMVMLTALNKEIGIDSRYLAANAKAPTTPTLLFAGRQKQISDIAMRLSKGDKERCICILSGAAGIGKTQLALKTIQQTENMWTSIVLVDATTHETATNSLSMFARARGIGKSSESTIEWLGKRETRWLMMIDNLNDAANLALCSPTGNFGSILITSRSSTGELCMRSNYFPVSNLGENEGLNLMMRVIGIKENEFLGAEHEAAIKLLEDIGYLAFAIVQAGAYIFNSMCTIGQYRDLLVQRQPQVLQAYSRWSGGENEIEWRAYTAWYMNYILLSTNAQQLLQLMAFMHHEYIIEDTFRRAAIESKIYERAPSATESRTEAQLYLTAFLQPYLSSTGLWDSDAFMSTMSELLCYFLVDYDAENRAYTMPTVGHEWARTIVEQPVGVAVEHTALLLAMSTSSNILEESPEYNRRAEVHIRRVLKWQNRS